MSRNLKNWFKKLGKLLVSNSLTLVLFSLLFLYQSVTAHQNPQTTAASISALLNYQGTLTDDNGNPITDSVEMEFALYTQAEGGSPIWTEAYTSAQAVQVTDGQFHVLLGSQTPLNSSDLSNDVFLGITINGEEMLPREILTGSPYAFNGVGNPFTVDGSLDVSGDVSINNRQLLDAYGVVNGGNIIRPASGETPAIRLISENSILMFIDSDNDAVNTHFRILKDNGSMTAPYSEIFRVDEGGKITAHGRLDMNGNSVENCGALTEANLQTPEELAADRIDRFEEGDLLCWTGEQLEKCDQANSSLVQAVADVNGRPIVIGAERIKVLGPVAMGDILVASDVPGYALVNNNPRPGTVIAQALEDFDGEKGLVKAMIRKW